MISIFYLHFLQPNKEFGMKEKHCISKMDLDSNVENNSFYKHTK